MEGLKGVRGVSPLWRGVATPLFANLAPPALLSLHDPHDQDRPPHLLKHFTTEVYPKLKVRVENDLYSILMMDAVEIKRAEALFKHRLKRLLRGKGEDEGQGGGLKELDLFKGSVYKEVEEVGAFDFYVGLLKYTPNLTSLSLDLRTHHSTAPLTPYEDDPILVNVRELKLKVQIQSPSEVSNQTESDYWVKRILRMVPNTKTLGLSSKSMSEIILRNQDMLQHLEKLVFSTSQGFHSYIKLTVLLMSIEKPLVEVSYQDYQSNSALRFCIHLAAPLKKHERALKVLKLVEEIGTTRSLELTLPPLNNLEKLVILYKGRNMTLTLIRKII